MMYWSKSDTPENVATQLWGTMFSVPQISNIYADTTPEQREVLKNYLDFWMAHKSTLMDGKLNVKLEGYGYGYATAKGEDEKISLAISTPICDATDGYARTYMVNLTDSENIILKAEKGAFVEIFDCRGKRVGGKKRVRASLSEIYVPLGACLCVTRK
jgi:hypothetical protein